MILLSQTDNPKLARVNLGLAAMVIAIGLYLLLAPLWPSIVLIWQNWTDDSDGYHYSSNLTDDKSLPPPPDYNLLLIPKIHLDEPLVEGPNSGVLAKGVWRRPKTSTPDQGSNTVFVGHRFTYRSPASFYHLDKLNVGDKFAVFWEGEEYDYEIIEVKVVPPDAHEIEAPTDDAFVTLYSCTPVWTAKNRIVVKGKLYYTTNKTHKINEEQT